MNQNQSLRIRRIKTYGTRAFAAAAVLLAVIILLNALISLLPAKLSRFDVTGNGPSELAAETEKFLGELDMDVTVYWLCRDGVVDEGIIGNWFPLLLERYEEASDRIEVVKVTDFEKDAALLEEMGLDENSNYALIVESARRSTIIDVAELFTYSSQFVNTNLNNGIELELTLEEMDQMIQMVYSYYYVDITQYTIYNHSTIANAKLTSALDYVTAETIPHAYILTGFGGEAVPTTLKTYLGIINEGVEELDIGKATSIPADAGCVILHAPSGDITEAQAAMINAYLNQGGALMLTTSPNTHVDQCPNLQSITASFGLTALPGIVFDNEDGYYVSGASTDVLTPKINSNHDLYQLSQSSSYAHRMPWSHAIEIAKTLPTGVTATEIMSTSSAAVRKEAGGVTETLGDAAVFNVAVEAAREVSVTSDGTAKTARIMWFASTEAFTDATAEAAPGNYLYYAYGSGFIRTGFVSAYESIPSVRVATETLGSMGVVMSIVVMAVVTVIIPAGLLTAGIVVWVKRRRRR